MGVTRKPSQLMLGWAKVSEAGVIENLKMMWLQGDVDRSWEERVTTTEGLKEHELGDPEHEKLDSRLQVDEHPS